MFIKPIFQALLMGFSASGAVTLAPCEAFLATAVLHGQPVDIPLSELKLENFALPAHNLGRPMTKQDDLVFLQSDIGATVWTESELQDWFNLGARRLVSHGPTAVSALARMALDPKAGCPPGILPQLCVAVQRSYHIRRETFPRDSIMWMVNEYRHMEEDLLLFPWRGAVYPSMSEASALAVMRVLARETLLRHLVGVSHDALPLETRLVLADFPSLIPLYPVFRTYPLDVQKEVAGDQPYILTDGALRISGIDGRFQAELLRDEEGVIDAHVRFHDGIFAHEILPYENGLIQFLNARAQEFAKMFAEPLKFDVHVQWINNEAHIATTLADGAQAALFMLYLRDHLEPL
jgi:hypothetical protein